MATLNVLTARQVALQKKIEASSKRFQEDPRSQDMFSQERLELSRLNSNSSATISSEFWGGVYDIYMKGPPSGPIDIHVVRSDGALEYSSLSCGGPDESNPYASKATFINVKSMNDLMSINKEKLLRKAGCDILDHIRSGLIIDSPALLVRGLLICFADVKAFKYFFWNACVQLAVPLGVVRETGPVQLLRYDPDLMMAIWKGVARQVQTSASTLPHTCATTLLPPVMGVMRDDMGVYQVVPLRKMWDRRYDRGSYIVSLVGGGGSRDENDDRPPASLSNILTLLWHHRDEYTYPLSTHNYREGIEREPALVQLVDLSCDGMLRHLHDTRPNVQIHCANLFLDNVEANGVVEQDRSKIYAIRLGDSPAARSIYTQFVQQVSSIASRFAPRSTANVSGASIDGSGMITAQADAALVSCVGRAVRAMQGLRSVCKQRSRLYDSRGTCSSTSASEASLVTAWDRVIQAEEEDRLARRAVVHLMSERVGEQEEADLHEDKQSTHGWEFEYMHRGAEAFVCSISKPRVANQAATCHPAELLDRASRLNNSLMRWQLYPTLKLDLIKDARCLLIGAGTLGCAVARSLLSWGFGKITFIDNGHVSFSNPTRQCLYELKDCLASQSNAGLGSGAGNQEDDQDGCGRMDNGGGIGRPKAHAAAEACTRVNPNIECRGMVIEIPYPGIVRDTKRRDAADKAVAAPLHDIYYGTGTGITPYTHAAHTDLMIAEDVRKTHTVLREAIEGHDVVFNLLDSREARWLPTLLCASLNKTMITGAVGFDSYLVMRHGGAATTPNTTGGGGNGGTSSDNHKNGSRGQSRYRLGCYFCSDLTSGAGGTAYEDRPLDRQCSVTRPGLSGIVGGLCTELAVELVQALAISDQDGDASPSTGDNLPHQIRGSLSNWTQERLTVSANKTCVACSHNVVNRYLGLDESPVLEQDRDSGGKLRYLMPQSTGVDFVVEVCMDHTGQKLEKAAGSSVLIAEVEKRMNEILLSEDSHTESEDEEKEERKDDY